MGKTKKKIVKKNTKATNEETINPKKKIGFKKLALRMLIWAGLILIVLFFVGGGILTILGR